MELTYEIFERIGLEMGVPYALLKIAWEAAPWAERPLKEVALRRAMLTCVRELTKYPEALAALKELSDGELSTGAIDFLEKEGKERGKELNLKWGTP